MRKELRGHLFWEDRSKLFSARDYSVWVSVMEKLVGVSDSFPLFSPLPPPFLPFSSAHQQGGPATEAGETFKYPKWIYGDKKGLRHSWVTLALQAGTALPGSGQDSGQPGPRCLSQMAESPFQSLCVLVSMHVYICVSMRVYICV